MVIPHGGVLGIIVVPLPEVIMSKCVICWILLISQKSFNQFYDIVEILPDLVCGQVRGTINNLWARQRPQHAINNQGSWSIIINNQSLLSQTNWIFSNEICPCLIYFLIFCFLGKSMSWKQTIFGTNEGVSFLL